MPYFENDVFNYFKKEIEESANSKILALKTEIEDAKKKQLKLIEDEIHDTVNKAIDMELNEINVDFSASMNRIKTTSHQEILKRKHEMMDSVISEVIKKCMIFVKSDQYRIGMGRLIKKINEEFCGEDFLFKIKKDDKTLEKIISDNFSKKFKVEKVDSIQIGGFIGVCTQKGILTDQTIDNRLEEARIKFYESSKLAVK